MSDEEGPDEAAQAFEELRAEVTLMRHAVERLSRAHGSARARQMRDYVVSARSRKEQNLWLAAAGVSG